MAIAIAIIPYLGKIICRTAVPTRSSRAWEIPSSGVLLTIRSLSLRFVSLLAELLASLAMSALILKVEASSSLDSASWISLFPLVVWPSLSSNATLAFRKRDSLSRRFAVAER